jgi:putative ABC transport system permease protein
MSLWTRITNVLRGGNRLNSEIDEELESHLEEAIAQGRDPVEARKAFGSALLTRETSRDVRLVAWLDSLRSDAVFGWRQLVKNKVTSSAAILSLALAIGACTSAFRLIDAILLRPLPVANPRQLYTVSRFGPGLVDAKPSSFDGWAYPSFQQMHDAVSKDAELIAVSYMQHIDLTYGSDQEMEKAKLQYVSGSMFASFGLRPAVGRLFTEDDDRKPGAHPYVVLSYDYWTRRFAQDRTVIGRPVHIGTGVFEIIGVGPETFTGTETGTFTDLFVPAVMHPGATQADWTWHRTLAHVKPGRSLEPIRARLDATSLALEKERAKGFTAPKELIDKYLDQTVTLTPASAGASDLQQDYRRALYALGVLVALVLLIACANVANLMTAQAASRAREMALRVSIGAGRLRLIQLVLAESGWISILAAGAGGMFAWWSAPFVVSLINPANNPARLLLPWDWRVFGFEIALTLTVTILFGLTPALRASAVQPSSALKGGDDPHARHRSMFALIAVQVAFCFVVVFVSSLFSASFVKLSTKPTGFSAERILALETVAPAQQQPLVWEQLAERLRTVPGVEKVSYAGSALLSGDSWNDFVSINGAPPSPVLAHLWGVSPGWIDTMKLRLLDGRDFRVDEPTPRIAIVNQTFVRQFLNGASPLHRTFERVSNGKKTSTEIVGVVNDAVYRSLREPILPVAYVPLLDSGTLKKIVTMIVRSSTANPVALAPALRRTVREARPDFRISDVGTQEEINEAQTVRERLLATLAVFFAVVAIALAGIGLYGILDYSVIIRRREIGIRMAIGAQSARIAGLVTIEAVAAVGLGVAAGLAIGLSSARYIESLFYEVTATDVAMLVIPSVTILTASLLAALPAVIHAVRLDPAILLRSE